MEHSVARALRELGYSVAIIPCRTGLQLAADLTNARPDVVFNATEHMYGDPAGDVHVAAMLEALRLPYTGGSPAALLLCRDKAATKSLAAAVGVRVPPFAVVPVGIDAYEPPPLPAVVKPALHDSSVGIGVASFVRTRKALDARIALVHRRFRETAIVESFIPGVDVNVFTLQGKRLQIFPPTARRVSAADATSPHSMATFHVKHNAAYRERWKIQYEYADVSASAMRLLHRDIYRLWPLLQLRDYARFDYRMTESGDLTLIEVNANPGFSPFSMSERWTWEEYLVAMKTVVENAIKRGG
jgi:D-alanine-D-alanine ligase